MIRKIEIERFSLTTSKAFNEVIAGVNAATAHPHMAEFGRSTHEARSFAELKSAVEKGLSKAGLMLFMQLDQGAVLQKETGQDTPRIIRFLIGNLHHPRQGLHDFLWGYFYLKSADWKGNKPIPLKNASAAELVQIPGYYIMDQSKGMAETVAALAPSPVDIGATPWLTEAELNVYVSEWGRTGFQGALNFYRVFVDPSLIAQFRLFSGRTIDVPSAFFGGKSDWAVYMTPGAVDVMRSRACTRMQEYALLDGAGHWLQQEQPDPVCRALVSFLRDNTERSQRP